MFIQSDKGLIIILGYSHADVVNILDYITKVTAQRRVYAIIGGMHVGQADDMRIQLTTDAFMALEVQKLMPLHCTGFRATAEMFWKMKDKCIIAGAGTQPSPCTIPTVNPLDTSQRFCNSFGCNVRNSTRDHYLTSMVYFSPPNSLYNTSDMNICQHYLLSSYQLVTILRRIRY